MDVQEPLIHIPRGHYNTFEIKMNIQFAYDLQKLQDYIIDYVNSEKRKASVLYALKKLIQQQKLQMIKNTYDDLYSLDFFGETIEGHRNINPNNFEEIKTFYNTHVDEDREILANVLTIDGFDNTDNMTSK